MKEFDSRLQSNFKLFLSGQSGCGKTTFIKDLLENLETFTQQPIYKVLYVFRTRQKLFDEMKHLVTEFIKDDENLEKNLNQYIKGEPILLIFDDLMNSKRLELIANFFTADGRHKNLSLAFLSQKLFFNNEYFKLISENSSYFVIFKNTRNQTGIKILNQQMTPGSSDLLEMYQDATKDPFSYLFINLTQECPPKYKYLANCFDYDHYIHCYVLE